MLRRTPSLTVGLDVSHDISRATRPAHMYFPAAISSLGADVKMGLPMSILPPLTKKTLVLDLDETLVHSSTRPPRRMRSDLVFQVHLNGAIFVQWCGDD